MNKIVLVFTFLLVQLGFSQTIFEKNVVSEVNDTIFNSTQVDVKPEYVGGITVFYKLISSNYNAPMDEKFKGGKVVVSFIVEKDGSLSDIKAVKDAGFKTGEEAVRVFKLSGKWIPAVKNGKNVRVNYVLPITLNSN